jgi:hypothetical protein
MRGSRCCPPPISCFRPTIPTIMRNAWPVSRAFAGMESGGGTRRGQPGYHRFDPCSTHHDPISGLAEFVKRLGALLHSKVVQQSIVADF